VVLTDGVVTQQASVPYSIGGYALAVTPTSQVVPATGQVAFNLGITGANGYYGPIEVSIDGLPAGATGEVQATQHASSTPLPFDVVTQNAAPGTYTFTVTGTAGSYTQSASASLQVQGSSPPPAFTGSVSPTSATIAVGQSSNFGISLSSQNGATGAISLQCPNLPSGLVCTFNPNSPSLPANGSVTDTLNVQANSIPAAAPLSPHLRWAPHGEGWRMIWLLAAVLAGLAAGSWLRNRKLHMAATSTALLGVILLFLAMATCGGGGSSLSPAPSPQSVTVSVTVQASGAGVSGTQTIGSLSVTVN